MRVERNVVVAYRRASECRVSCGIPVHEASLWFTWGISVVHEAFGLMATSRTSMLSPSTNCRWLMPPTALRSAAAVWSRASASAGAAMTALVIGTRGESFASVLARRIPVSAWLARASRLPVALAAWVRRSTGSGHGPVCTDVSWFQLHASSVANGITGAESRRSTLSAFGAGFAVGTLCYEFEVGGAECPKECLGNFEGAGVIIVFECAARLFDNHGEFGEHRLIQCCGDGGV